VKNCGSKIAEIDKEFEALIGSISELEKKIAILKNDKKTPKSHLVLQELIADTKELLTKQNEDVIDLNFVYEQRISTL